MKKKTNDQFLIGSWVSFYPFEIHDYEYQLDQMQAAGLNFNIFPLTFANKMDNPEDCDRVEKAYAARTMRYFMYGGMSEEGMERAVRYAQDKAHCIGYHLLDEPVGDALSEVGRVIRAYREADGKRYPFVNLLPSYAGEERLGGTYYEHCARFVSEAGAENIEYLSHDYYPFHLEITCPEIFADTEVMRRVAWENGRLRTHAFPQSSAWNSIRMPNIDEMRWHVYGYLAYGFKALSWFNLVCPGNSDTEGEGFRDSIIYRDGTIRNPQLFEDFGNLNREILTLGETLMKLDTVHAYHTQADVAGVEKLPADWMITPVRQENFIISQMVTAAGDQTYVMLFNKDWAHEATASFAVSPFSGIESLEYVSPFDGMTTTITPEDGVFTDTFRPGEGKLYKLNGKVSHRVFPLDGTRSRADIDLASPQAVVGLDVVCPLHKNQPSVSLQISTNKRFTEERTKQFTFDAIPESGELRFEFATGKYIRAMFSGAEEAPLYGWVEVRVRFADEPVLPEEVEVPFEEIVPCEEPEAESEAVETIEAAEEIEMTAETELDVLADDEPSAEVSSSDVNYADLNDALAVVDGLVEAEYTANSWQAVREQYDAAVALKSGSPTQDEITDAYWHLLDRVRELEPVQWTLPKPEIQDEQAQKKTVHVSGGILTATVATLAGAVVGGIVGLFASKAKKNKK